MVDAAQDRRGRCSLRQRGSTTSSTCSACASSPSAREPPLEMLMQERLPPAKLYPTWTEQLTVRGFVVGFLLSILFSVIVMKLNLTTGIIPSLSFFASILAFFLVRLVERYESHEEV